MPLTHQKASCLCGAVKMVFGETKDTFGACHCGMCQTWGGGPLLSLDCGTDVKVEGEDSISLFQSSDWAERGFCKKCGSHLFYRLNKKQYYVPIGILENGKSLPFSHQIFIDRKPETYRFANETANMTEAEVFAQFMS